MRLEVSPAGARWTGDRKLFGGRGQRDIRSSGKPRVPYTGNVREKVSLSWGARALGSAMFGGLLAGALWALLVPRDLSAVSNTRPPYYYSAPGSFDEVAAGNTSRIALVLLALILVALILAVLGRPPAKWLAVGGSTVWAGLFDWRAAVSRTEWADLWPVLFFMFVLPAAVFAPLMVHAVARRRSRGFAQTAE